MSINAERIRQEQCVKNKLWIIDVGNASRGLVLPATVPCFLVSRSKVGKRTVRVFKKS